MNKKEKQGMKKSTKAIIAAVVAVVLVAAVLIGIFVIKPAIEKKDNNSDFSYSDIEKPEGAHYEYVSYKGTEMVKDLVLIFEQAEKDDKKSIDKNGYAFKFGDYEISKGELVLYYLDEYSLQNSKVEYSIQTKGQNLTGFDPEKLPTEQKVPGESFTWSDKFVSTAIQNIKDLYVSFDLAIEAGVTFTENEIYGLINNYKRVERLADVSETPDDLVARIYGEDTTYAIFARREIMQKYALRYEEMRAAEHFEAVTEDEIRAEFEKDTDYYKSIDVRVYPVQGEYDPAEISSVANEQEFLDFAKKNYPSGNYNAEVITKIYNTTKSQLGATFGEEVAEWAFASDRVEGEIALITGQLYQYLVYIKSLPVYDFSHDIILYNYKFENGETAEQKDKIYEDKEKLYKELEGRQITAEEFLLKIDSIDYACEEMTARASDLYYQVSDWMLEEGRKQGDTAIFSDSAEGIFIVYYEKANPDDLDWRYAIRSELGNIKYVEEYEKEFVKYSYSENAKVFSKVVGDADAIIKGKLKANKK